LTWLEVHVLGENLLSLWKLGDAQNMKLVADMSK